MKAFLKNYRQSPRKVRLVAELIKGKRVAEAFIHLNSLPKRAANPIKVLLSSALANAKNLGISTDDLWIDSITVNKGVVLKRSIPRAHGSASRINKRTSRIMLILSEKSPKEKSK
jgi:large subunit ribosomal protein L22